MLMLALVVWGNFMRCGDRLFQSPHLLRLFEFAAPLGFIAVLAGWITTETGRQPWTVYGLLRTANSVTPSLTGSDVLLSLLGYAAAYFIMYPSGLFLIARVIRSGPRHTTDTAPVGGGRPRAPVVAP